MPGDQYGFKRGSRLDPKKAPVVARELRKLETSGGGLRPADVVRAARKSRSPLHPFFEWDNTAAAEKYRLEQARSLIRCITVIYDKAPTAEPVRGYQHLRVEVEEPEEAEALPYHSTIRVMSDAKYREALVREALQDFEEWRTRYQSLRELAAIFTAAEKVTRSLKQKRGRKTGVGKQTQKRRKRVG
jgi:hypothetical protein